MTGNPEGATGGGVTITGGTVSTSGGDIVGRDKVQYISTTQLDVIFDPVEKALKTASPDQQTQALEKLKTLKAEASQGGVAKDAIVGKLIEDLVRLVPAAIGAVVTAFGTPILGGISGPVTKYVLEKIQGKPQASPIDE